MNALILLFYRIVTFFTRVPKETRLKHSGLIREKLTANSYFQDDFINDQHSFASILYGSRTMDINGCGPIALHNAIAAFSNNVSSPNNIETLSSIIRFLEKYGVAFMGALGTSPFAINKYLKKEGFNTKTFWLNSKDKLNNFSENYKGFISVIYTDSTSLKYGLHFIFTEKKDNGLYTAHNPLSYGNSLYDVLSKCTKNELKHVYTIGINKK